MSTQIELLKDNMQKMQSCFLKLEDISTKMLLCPVEEMEDFLNTRTMLMQQIDETDEEIAHLNLEPEDFAAVKNIFAKSAENYTGILGEIQSMHRDIRSILMRLKENDPQINSRLESKKENILKQIKNANLGAGAHAAKFLTEKKEFSAFGKNA